MGVRNLHRFLTARKALPTETELPSGACLLVDGTSFLFYICNKNISQQDKLFGGDYSSLDQAIEEEINVLRTQLGLQLIVFFDGPQVAEFKQETSHKRGNRREEEWTNWQSYCKFPTNRLDSSTIGDFPQIPQLAFRQFSCTLNRLNVEQIACVGEADLEISFRIQLMNHEGVYFCYARDSDYVVMQNCPYIEFGTLKKKKDRVYAPVYVRKALCDKLQMTEHAFVDLCLFLGNDFLPEDVVFTVESPALTEQHTLGGYDECMKRIELFTQGDGVLLSSATHQGAIDYSRKFYNLGSREDMLALCGEPTAARQDKEERFLSEEERRWCDSITQDFVSPLLLLRHVQLKQKGTPGFFPQLHIVHLYAMSQMLACKQLPQEMNTAAMPQWEDIVAGQIWQSICRILFRNSCLPTLEPSQLFHGQLYHYFLQVIRDQESPNTQQAYATTAKLVNNNRKNVVALGDGLLPIDEKREEILTAVNDNQVTLICGETGCGKSTKVCLFLVQQAQRSKRKIKMLISQPTRIAVQALTQRMRQTLGRRVGMRMGNNTVDEFPETDVWFVTTGYLVQRLAALSNFDEFSHIIIDEMHERSTQADLAVLLAKKLVTEHESSTKLVLMSATANINLYQDYFESSGLSTTNLFVGAKRFENDIYYAQDLPDCPGHLTGVLACTLSITPSMSRDQCKIVVHLVRNGAIPLGSGVLVFVSGLADIEHLHELLEPFAPRVVLFAIHSQLSEEYNHALFAPCEQNQIKVIVATNAAQSSITIPDVDFVIDLGTHKSMQYDQRTHTSVLVEQWISQSSATQRAGRTGRVKPGTVFRLYAQQVFEQEFSEHDTAEILETPLDDTIINLRNTFEHHINFTGVVPILNEMLEVPEMSRIQNSFNSLHRQQMISEPNDFGALTTCGRFVARLSIGAGMGRLVALGICFGVGWEITVIANALSQMKPCFRMTHQLIHTPEENYEILQANLSSILALDCGYESEAIMMLQICKLFKQQQGETERLVRAFSMSHDRIRGFLRSCDHLLHQVGKLILNPEFALQTPEFEISPEKLTMLRLLLTWSSAGRVIKLDQPAKQSDQVVLSFAEKHLAPSGKLVQNWFPNVDAEEWEYSLASLVYSGKLADREMTPSDLCVQLREVLQCSILALTEDQMFYLPQVGCGFQPEKNMVEDAAGVFSMSTLGVDVEQVTQEFSQLAKTTARNNTACAVCEYVTDTVVEITTRNLAACKPQLEATGLFLLGGGGKDQFIMTARSTCQLRFPAQSLTCQLVKTYIKNAELRYTQGADVIRLPVNFTFPAWKPVHLELDNSVFRLMQDDDEEDYWEVFSNDNDGDEDSGLIEMGSKLIISRPSVAFSYPKSGTSFGVVSRSMEHAPSASPSATMQYTGRKSTVAEFVTILPNAQVFLPLALACAGWKPRKTNTFKKHRLNSQDAAACAMIRDELSKVLRDEERITPHHMLASLVSRVFPVDANGAQETHEKCVALQAKVKQVLTQRGEFTPSKKAGTPGKGLSTPGKGLSTPTTTPRSVQGKIPKSPLVARTGLLVATVAATPQQAKTPPPGTKAKTPPPATKAKTPPPATKAKTPPPATIAKTPPPATKATTPPPPTPQTAAKTLTPKQEKKLALEAAAKEALKQVKAMHTPQPATPPPSPPTQNFEQKFRSILPPGKAKDQVLGELAHVLVEMYSDLSLEQLHQEIRKAKRQKKKQSQAAQKVHMAKQKQ